MFSQAFINFSQFNLSFQEFRNYLWIKHGNILFIQYILIIIHVVAVFPAEALPKSVADLILLKCDQIDFGNFFCFQCFETPLHEFLPDSVFSVIFLYTDMIKSCSSAVMPAEDRADDFPSHTATMLVVGFLRIKRSTPSFESSMLRIPKPWISIQRLCTCSKSSIVMGRIVKFVSFMLFFIFLAVCLSGAVFYKSASHAVHLGRMAAPWSLTGTLGQDLIPPPHRNRIRGSCSALPDPLHLLQGYRVLPS